MRRQGQNSLVFLSRTLAIKSFVRGRSVHLLGLYKLAYIGIQILNLWLWTFICFIYWLVDLFFLRIRKRYVIKIPKLLLLAIFAYLFRLNEPRFLVRKATKKKVDTHPPTTPMVIGTHSWDDWGELTGWGRDRNSFSRDEGLLSRHLDRREKCGDGIFWDLPENKEKAEKCTGCYQNTTHWKKCKNGSVEVAEDKSKLDRQKLEQCRQDFGTRD